MAWVQRGEHRYYYRSVRDGKTVKHIYYGAGQAGEIAAALDSERQAELQAIRQSKKMLEAKLKTLCELTNELHARCELLAAAELLAAGYHRPDRHSWRKWRNGLREINRNC